MVVPSHPTTGDKLALRRQARQHRQAFVEALDPEAKSLLEQQLAERLKPLVSQSRIVGGYCPMPAEISPIPALDVAKAAGAVIAYPAFSSRHEPFRFLAGEPSLSGLWATLEPPLTAPHVFPDLVLLPLVAIDRRGTRLGQGKGHYDRVVADLKRNGTMLIGIGWAIQLIDGIIPADPWDVPLDGFASPDGLEMFR
ncbi:5-formyltetrahydrofolate cyclo-ligase [Sphingomonas xanthus]|uniref:5-formyltetrahydrofolate cyclo-ligase n=1 Tax=Sphingomonas xanthus TaxID=2594473 RepID=A0A516ITU2_9SPHN|nr:5-formyltetrahydrofolate cyclo-ligase [Sphingomonas xanthus]QDP20290.1 5-formyltetrahydrofolate cyclo-ligase [Sphingomonas xanthus]